MIRLLLALMLAFGLCAPAFAEKAADHGDGAKTEGKKEEAHGPDVAGVAGIKKYDLGIYTLIVFGALFLILAKFAWKPFNEGLAAREKSIAGARDEAIKAKHDAEKIRNDLKAEFAGAADKIRAMMDEARKDADDLRAKEREIGVKEAQAERERAKHEIAMAKDQAMQEIQQTAVQLAALMSSKAVRRSVSTEDHTRLIQESMDELKRSVKA